LDRFEEKCQGGKFGIIVLTFVPGVEEDELHSTGTPGRYPSRLGSFVHKSNYRFPQILDSVVEHGA